MDELRTKWVVPYYLQFLHANYLADERAEEPRAFKKRVDAALAEIDEGIVSLLLAEHWREQITASYFAGLKGWSQYADTIGNLLVQSVACYAGQGYCFALACFADETSVKYLQKYLRIYLAQPQLYYDQYWAMPALIWIDERKGTQHSAEFLKPGGLWETFVAGKNESWQLDKCWPDFRRAMNYWRRE